MKKIFVRLLYILIFLTVAPRIASAETPETLDEYTHDLKIHHDNKTFLSIRDDFRKRLNQDADGVLVNKILNSPDLRGMLFANFDVVPDKFKDIILAEHLKDDSIWYLNGGMLRSPASGIACEIFERFQPKDWVDVSALTVALEDRGHREAISLVLRDLSEKQQTSPSTMAQELRDAARDEIAKIVAIPTGKLTEKGNGGGTRHKPTPEANRNLIQKNLTTPNSIHISPKTTFAVRTLIVVVVLILVSVIAWLMLRRR